MIRFAHTCFQYADSGDGVEDIGLHVRKGECVVLTGPSGNGKTTLTRLVNGLAPAFYAGRLSGAVELGGRDRREEPLWQRGRLVGSVFQDPKSQFFSSQLAGEVAFACENYGIPHDEIVSRTDAAIRAFRLEGLRDRPLDVLSSGEKQRTAMASVCALDPPVLVCDEPTAIWTSRASGSCGTPCCNSSGRGAPCSSRSTGSPGWSGWRTALSMSGKEGSGGRKRRSRCWG